jgi:hypothetical protein
MGLMNAARHRLGTGDIIWRCCAKVAELPTKFSHRNSRRSLYNRHKDKLVSLRRVNSASRSLHVLRDVVAERPVFRQHFDQVDEDPFRAQAGVGGQFFDDAPKQLLLLRARAGVADGELNDDEVIAALDAEIVCVVGEIIFVVPRVRCSTPLMPVNSMRRSRSGTTPSAATARSCSRNNSAGWERLISIAGRVCGDRLTS